MVSSAYRKVENILAKTAGIYAMIKKKIKFSSYIRKFNVEQLQSHI
jgi:hypothetical protein